MNRKFSIIISIQLLIIVLLFWALMYFGKDEFEALSQKSEEKIVTPNHMSNKLGMAVITLDKTTQEQSGIKTSTLLASSHLASLISYGSVISIDSLIEMRSRYIAVIAEAQVLSASLAHNKNEYNRVNTLNQDDKNVSDKVVAAALADIKSDEVKLFAAESSANSIADSMRLAWGEALTKLATDKNISPLLQNIINYKVALIQITLPFDTPEPMANDYVMITPTTATSLNAKAIYLSPAPTSNPTFQGKTYYYYVNSNKLRTGMQVKVLSTSNLSNSKKTGVIVPNTAVVWYAGKPWVYRKTGNDQFSRYPIKTEVEIENGWFYIGDLKPNDVVVTSGAQLLLSEEFKSQITNENED